MSQYPDITPGDRTQISPSVPVGRTCPASSRMVTSQPGTGAPTLPGRFLPVTFDEMAVAASVQP